MNRFQSLPRRPTARPAPERTGPASHAMLLTRILTVAILLPFFIGGLFFLPGKWWAISLLPLVLAGAWEWANLAGFRPAMRALYCLVLIISSIVILSAQELAQLMMIDRAIFATSAVFWLLLAPLWLKFGWKIRSPFLMAITGWVLLIPTWLALSRLQVRPWLLLALMGIVWVADSAAYFAGHQWGRRKLAPSISPGKTWEGVAGAALAVAVYHALVWNFGFAPHAPGLAFGAAALITLLFPLSIIGDLFESWIKRQAGVKDSGRLLPGHGGVLDRIDALTSTLPLAALALTWLTKQY